MRATRRLGRGLGAFLDFGPAGADGAAFVSDAIASDGASVLETSTGPAEPAARPPEPAPVPSKPSPPPPPAPTAVELADESPFVDDIVVDVGFPEVELE